MTHTQASAVEELAPGCPTFDEIVAAFGKSDRGYPHTYQGIVDLVRSRWPKRTRPSVDEEFLRAAKTLRAEYASTDEYVEHSPTYKILAEFDAALASVEGKPAKPTAVDERRDFEWLHDKVAELITEHDEWTSTVEILAHRVQGMDQRLTALERAQANEGVECNACHGSGTHGALNGSAPCWLCHGRGKVKTLVSLHGTMPPPAPAVKGEAVAGWMPTTDEMLDAANGCYGNTRDEMESVRRLISHRAPRVDVRQLMRDYLGEWAPDKIGDHHVEAMTAALAKQSIPTEEVKGG